ncbi:MAG: TonB-dependent receptor [Sphingomonadaceae bacterium]
MTKSTIRNGVSFIGLVGILAAAPTAALAQSDEGVDNDVIIVTAQRRAEAQVDVPISITNISSDALETANIDGLGDIAKVTPGLRFDSGGGGFFQPSIRGIGTAVTTSGGGANVGIYVDGFYSPNPLAADFDLISVDSIQVLKGPQGTLFGRNTTGGAILISTREPDPETVSAEGSVSYGRFEEVKAQSFINLGIDDRLALTVEGLYHTGNGFRRYIEDGSRADEFENWSFRTGLRGVISDNADIILRWKHSESDDPGNTVYNTFTDGKIFGAPFGGVPGTFTTDPDLVQTGSVPEYFNSNSDVIQLTLNVDLGFADFTSYSQYRNEKVDQTIEVDYSGIDIFQLGLPNRNKTTSQEFLLSSKPGTRLQWTAGLFYFENTDVYITTIDSPGSRIRFGGSGTTVKSAAAFIDGTYEVTPQLFITAGVRYAKDKITDAYYNTRFLDPTPVTLPDGTSCPADGGEVYLRDCDPDVVDFVNDDRITPRFVIRYKPTEETSIYASFTKGYKAAILDVGGTCQNAPFVCSRVKPETIDAYEVGMKYDGNGISAELSGYYYDYKNLQVSLFRTGTAQIVNAANSEIYGFDGQVRYEVSPAFTINAGASWVHARYKDFAEAPIYTACADLGADFVTNVCAPNGLTFVIVPSAVQNGTMQRTPEFTGSLGARYVADVGGGELALSGNLYYTSSFFFGPSGNQFKQGGYETLSLRAQWTDPSDRFYLAAFGDNVTDSRYYTQVGYSNFGIGGVWNKPVTYGIELGFKFGG